MTDQQAVVTAEVLLKKRSAKNFLKGYSAEEIQSMITMITGIKEDIEKAEAEKIAAENERNKKIEMYVEMLGQDGLSLDIVNDWAEKNQKKRTK
ncbi:H-NS family histone-like protein [Photobacterium damselae]|uniref:H-NS family histone-like protein n=1 Tax=Photobacterium damselae TaxID=38293 RepID=UPI00370B53BE